MTDAIRELQARRVGDVEIGVLLHYVAELSRTTRLAQHQYATAHSLMETWGEASALSDPAQQLPRELDLFAFLEGFLTAYARTSLLLFPGKDAFATKRGNALREFLTVPADHPIGRRTLRNDWMHVDRRLDVMIQKGERAGWGFMVLPKASSASDGFRETFLRLVDPATEDIFFLGRPYSLRELANHVQSVRNRIDPALASIAPADA